MGPRAVGGGGRPLAFRRGAGEDLIGLYGIGMKRAIFKMGALAEVHSSTADEGFRVDIDVEKWISAPEKTWPPISAA